LPKPSVIGENWLDVVPVYSAADFCRSVFEPNLSLHYQRTVNLVIVCGVQWLAPKVNAAAQVSGPCIFESCGQNFTLPDILQEYCSAIVFGDQIFENCALNSESGLGPAFLLIKCFNHIG
jgi:hypothetical protein